MIPKISFYKIKNLLEDGSKYPTISHKKCFVPSVNVLDIVGKIGGIVFIYIYKGMYRYKGIHIYIYIREYIYRGIYIYIYISSIY